MHDGGDKRTGEEGAAVSSSPPSPSSPSSPASSSVSSVEDVEAFKLQRMFQSFKRKLLSPLPPEWGGSEPLEKSFTYLFLKDEAARLFPPPSTSVTLVCADAVSQPLGLVHLPLQTPNAVAAAIVDSIQRSRSARDSTR